MANARESFLSPSQPADIDRIVQLSCNYNYLLRADLISGRRDLSRAEAHTTRAHRPCDLPTQGRSR
jgi:hypothetical protein